MSHATGAAGKLSADEKRALLSRLLKERPAQGRAEDSPVVRLFEAQVGRTPDAVAVRCSGDSVTYRQLNEESNRLAHRLRRLGVRPETLVGVCLDRSPRLIAALLGVLKAGGAYVPIDPAYPDERIEFMVRDSGLRVLLTEQDLLERLPHDEGVSTLCVDTEWAGLDAESSDNPNDGAHASNLAYVIYTSGSTGKPKGVQVTLGALTNFLLSMRKLLNLTERDALLAITTLSFDIAALELYLPLIVGARIEIVDRDEAADGARLAHRLDDPSVTFMQATPATWRLLLDGGWKGRPTLTMLCGGEALSRDLADRLNATGGTLWNLYGPTETTIWSSAGRVEPGEGAISIGRPIANTQMYVLDAHLRPVPVGVTGELYIGGAGLARGYLGRPALTAERFRPDPFGKAAGSRLYQTGDLARWRPDGTLECLGRIDHQVKIRGFRVELGEIEIALRRHPHVRDAVVTARDDGTREQGLAAYLVAEQGERLDLAEVRRGLQDVLPDYMVPTMFVILESLPLTPNGKVDRKALPDPASVAVASATVYVPPRGPIEQELVGIWRDLLRRDRIGIHDNFFDLGGHSLFATQLIARLRDTFGVELVLRSFLEDATIASLAKLIERELVADGRMLSPDIVPVDRSGLLPISFSQQMLWFLDQLEPNSATYNIPTAVRLDGTLDRDALAWALTEIVRRHEVLRTTFKSIDGVPRQQVMPAGPIPLPVVELADLPEDRREDEARRIIFEEAARPFDLTAGPLLRARLIGLSETAHIIVVTMHHIASDAWSIGVLIREAAALYAAAAAGDTSGLPEPPLQYGDYAVWQRSWLDGDVLQGQLEYWRDQLGGVPTLELPTDRPRPAILRNRRGGQRSLLLPSALVDELKTLGRAEGATLFMTLLAAFEILLHRYSGQEDFAVGTPIAGRTRSELENLIGFFVNTLALRASLRGEPSFREVLRRVRQAALGSYAHQELPFDQIVNVLQPERDPARTPLFQVMFAFQNVPPTALESPEMTMTPIEVDSGTAKFDLVLFVSDDDNGLDATLEYDADLFEVATVERMLLHFRILLESAVAQPDVAVGSLPMLTEEERRLLLNQGRDAADEEAMDLEDIAEEDLDRLLAELNSGGDAGDS